MLLRNESIAVCVQAPAKLNLFLDVLRRRDDGYHDLESLMVSVGLSDELRLAPAPDGEVILRCIDARGRPPAGGPPREPLPAGADNLVVKAARLLQQHTGTSRGAQIDLIKRVPLAAGLAGGSSDAAAALVGLNRLWRLGLPADELQRLAAQLGSDVPFFLCRAAAAICRGRGEVVEPLRLSRRLHFVISRPRSGLATAEVFRNCRPAPVGWSAADVACRLQAGPLDRAAKLFHNSLQEPAERLSPEVSRLRRAFARMPFIGHQMSGSGTAYFGLCRTRPQATQFAARLERMRLGDVFVASSRP